MKNPIILFRDDRDNEEEYRICCNAIATTNSRTQVPPGSLVVGRYSVLPFYKELDRDLAINGSHLINSYSEHRWIADLQQWYPYFQDITPATWFRLEDAVWANGPFVLKGETNSKKFEWDTHMFAADTEALRTVYMRLQEDSLIGSQQIYIRQYVELKKFFTGLRGLPITNEHRIFFLDGEVVGSGFYWSSHSEELTEAPTPPPEDFVKEIGSRLKARFVVADVAETASGGWTLIELNDGQMSGLSDTNAEQLYSNIAKKLKGR